MAKLYATEVAHKAVDVAVQVWGGEGYCKPNLVERLYRDQRITEVYEGSSEIQRVVIGRAIKAEAEAETAAGGADMAGLPADAEPPSGARPAARGEGRDAILEAAAAAFTERGYTATTIDDIADRLGATKGRVYHYYRSKADIFLDIHRYAMQRMLDEMTPLAAALAPPRRGSPAWCGPMRCC